MHDQIFHSPAAGRDVRAPAFALQPVWVAHIAAAKVKTFTAVHPSFFDEFPADAASAEADRRANAASVHPSAGLPWQCLPALTSNRNAAPWSSQAADTDAAARLCGSASDTSCDRAVPRVSAVGKRQFTLTNGFTTHSGFSIRCSVAMPPQNRLAVAFLQQPLNRSLFALQTMNRSRLFAVFVHGEHQTAIQQVPRQDRWPSL